MKNILSALIVAAICFQSCAQKHNTADRTASQQTRHTLASADTSMPASAVHAQSTMDVAQRFIRDLANPDIALDVILSRYVLTSDADDELYDYMLASLAEVRLNLMSKRLEDIRFIPYAERSRREVADIDPEGKNTENMIFLQHGKRQLTALYIEQDKIASFTLVSKGNNMAHFVTY